MPVRDRQALAQRSGAELFSFITKVAGALVVVATIFVVAKESKIDQTLNISNQHSPLVWATIFVGLSVALILCSIGYGLGLLCATYDRETYLAQLVVDQARATRVALGAPHEPDGPHHVRTDDPVAGPSSTPSASLDNDESLWDWLTKKRQWPKR